MVDPKLGEAAPYRLKIFVGDTLNWYGVINATATSGGFGRLDFQIHTKVEIPYALGRGDVTGRVFSLDGKDCLLEFKWPQRAAEGDIINVQPEIVQRKLEDEAPTKLTDDEVAARFTEGVRAFNFILRSLAHEGYLVDLEVHELTQIGITPYPRVSATLSKHIRRITGD